MTRRAVVIDLTPPCSTCLHEAVCSIRRAIELLPALEVDLLDAAFALDVTSTIVCSEYLPETPVKIRRQYTRRGSSAKAAAG